MNDHIEGAHLGGWWGQQAPTPQQNLCAGLLSLLVAMARRLHLLQRQLSQHPLTDVGGRGQLSDGFAVSGRPGRPHGWHANLRANPEVTVHLKQSMIIYLTRRLVPDILFM